MYSLNNAHPESCGRGGSYIVKWRPKVKGAGVNMLQNMGKSGGIKASLSLTKR